MSSPIRKMFYPPEFDKFLKWNQPKDEVFNQLLDSGIDLNSQSGSVSVRIKQCFDRSGVANGFILQGTFYDHLPGPLIVGWSVVEDASIRRTSQYILMNEGSTELMTQKETETWPSRQIRLDHKDAGISLIPPEVKGLLVGTLRTPSEGEFPEAKLKNLAETEKVAAFFDQHREMLPLYLHAKVWPPVPAKAPQEQPKEKLYAAPKRKVSKDESSGPPQEPSKRKTAHLVGGLLLLLAVGYVAK